MVLEHTEEKQINLLIKEDYFDRFYQIKGGELSDKEAYLELEEEYFKQYGVYKYTSYPSFKTMKCRYLNKLVKKNKK